MKKKLGLRHMDGTPLTVAHLAAAHLAAACRDSGVAVEDPREMVREAVRLLREFPLRFVAQSLPPTVYLALHDAISACGFVLGRLDAREDLQLRPAGPERREKKSGRVA